MAEEIERIERRLESVKAILSLKTQLSELRDAGRHLLEAHRRLQGDRGDLRLSHEYDEAAAKLFELVDEG